MSIYYADDTITLHHGDSLEVARTLEAGSVDCIVTSPPYFGLRDYGNKGQYGLEESPAAYAETMRALFAELRRALSNDGTLWMNIGDSYSTRGGNLTSGRTGIDSGKTYGDIRGRAGDASGLPNKNLIGTPWRVAFALQDDGWILRNSIIWHKPNAMPESVTDRLSSRHENLFMFSKSQRYWFDLDPIREKQGDASIRRGKNPGDVWAINTQPFPGAHFAVMPQELARRAIVAGCKPGGTVLDPFSGSGTTGLVAQSNGRKYIGIDISADYLKLSLETRLHNAALDFGGAA